MKFTLVKDVGIKVATAGKIVRAKDDLQIIREDS